jgi:glycosyltransferase involved in cell wall biosynthesis
MKHKEGQRLPCVLFVLQLPPPIHGASLSNSYLVNSELIQKNYYLNVVNLQFASSMKELKKFTISKIFKAFVYGVEIFKNLVTKKPDLVYFALSPFGYAFYRDAVYVFIFKLFKVKILFHLHGKGIKQETDNSRLKRSIYRRVFRNTNVICQTNSLTKDIENVSTSVPFIVPCGIPVHETSKKSKASGLGNVVRVLYLSNYVKTKGIFELIDALDILRAKGYEFEARLVGAPTDLSVREVAEYIGRKKLQDSIKVIGPKYGDDKYAEFENTDIFVFPTFYSNETIGLVNLEAMQYALPIITTTEGGIPEIVINNETGFIIDVRDVIQLAKKLAELIDNEDLRREMGRKGYERFIENYTLDHFVTNIDKTFQDILTTN